MTITEQIQQRDGVAVVVYTQPNCVQCKQTFFVLDRAGIVYTKVDVTEDETALAYVKRPVSEGGLGYLAAPVVVASTIDGDITWNGFRNDLLKQHITDQAKAAA